MNAISQTFIKIDDNQLIALIESASERLAYISPGLSLNVANALIKQWQILGIDHVKIILDDDPEVLRLGYGNLDGLESIYNAAKAIGGIVNCQSGLRICMLVVDHSAVVFSPTPLSIESGSGAGFHPNGMWLDQVPISILNDIGWGHDGSDFHAIGKQTISPTQIKKTKQDLEQNPPQKFDISRSIQVFNSRFEFVELTVRGCSFSRKTVRIPSDLLGFITDKEAQSKFLGEYRIFQQKSESIELKINSRRKEIENHWLIKLPHYGSILLRKNKEKFLESVDSLKAFVTESQEEIEKSLQDEFEKNIDILVTSLLPFVINNPPQRWIKYSSLFPTHHEIRQQLESDLRIAFGSPKEWIGRMEVRVMIKGITYETLNDPKFISTIHKAIPASNLIYNEFSAAPSSQLPFNY